MASKQVAKAIITGGRQPITSVSHSQANNEAKPTHTLLAPN